MVYETLINLWKWLGWGIRACASPYRGVIALSLADSNNIWLCYVDNAC